MGGEVLSLHCRLSVMDLASLVPSDYCCSTLKTQNAKPHLLFETTPE